MQVSQIDLSVFEKSVTFGFPSSLQIIFISALIVSAGLHERSKYFSNEKVCTKLSEGL